LQAVRENDLVWLLKVDFNRRSSAAVSAWQEIDPVVQGTFTRSGFWPMGPGYQAKGQMVQMWQQQIAATCPEASPDAAEQASLLGVFVAVYLRTTFPNQGWSTQMAATFAGEAVA